MVIPVAVVELDEPNAFLGEAAGQQGIAREGARGVHVGSVALHDRLAFAGEVHEFGHARLHTVSHLGLADTRGDLGVARGSEIEAIQFVGALEQGLALLAGEPVRVAEIKHRLAGASELHALVGAG